MTKKILSPTAEDARKLLQAIAYLKSTADLHLRLNYIGTPRVHTYIDASFATHPTRRSHTSVYVTLGQGGLFTKSTMQKINTSSSCKAEIVALAKGMQQSLWARSFLTKQGFPPHPVRIYKDNQAAIQLIELLLGSRPRGTRPHNHRIQPHSGNGRRLLDQAPTGSPLHQTSRLRTRPLRSPNYRTCIDEPPTPYSRQRA